MQYKWVKIKVNLHVKKRELRKLQTCVETLQQYSHFDVTLYSSVVTIPLRPSAVALNTLDRRVHLWVSCNFQNKQRLQHLSASLWNGYTVFSVMYEVILQNMSQHFQGLPVSFAMWNTGQAGNNANLTIVSPSTKPSTTRNLDNFHARHGHN
jgi:hypothetical protein